MGIGSESDGLLGQSERILRISDSETGVNEEKLGDVSGGEGNSGNDEVGLLTRERRSLDMLSVKKEAKESARELPEVEEGKGEEDYRCRSLFTVCHRCLGFSL